MHNLPTIREWHNTTRESFFENVYPLYKPAVLRGLAKDWPIVAAANAGGNESAVSYITSFDNYTPVYTIVGKPEINGRFFYSDDLSGVNFEQTQGAITAILEQLLGISRNPRPHAVAIQAAQITEALPGFAEQNSNPILDPSVAPTMWLGNSGIVAPHYDVLDNIACVAVGRRTFTLFPPEQIANLYVGPTLSAPGGVPISMVDLHNPDLDKFPNFSLAMQSASQATLEPGDAIFIPSPWWHAVESHETLNVLVNYWWGGVAGHSLSANHSLLHSMLTIPQLSPAQRKSWRHFFDYFVFKESGDPSAHLPAELNDIVTTLSSEQKHSVLEFLKSKLQH